MTEKNPFDNLTPNLLWRHFESITHIARPSGHEDEIISHIRQWAMSHEFDVLKDQVGNLCVHVPGTDGMEDAPVIVLQNHVDMICERDSDSDYDASVGKMKIVRDGDWIRATGTTLGADNGLGVATAMAVIDEGIEHPPLDLLFTVDEETGLTGAVELDGSMLRGKTMINLDSEEDGVLFVGCAGGCDTLIRFSGIREPVPRDHAFVKISTSGLLGGHSGIDINKNRLNAIKAVAGILESGSDASEIRVVEINGGKMRNAIPRESWCVAAIRSDEKKTFLEKIGKKIALLKEQYISLESELKVDVVELTEAPLTAFTADYSIRMINLLNAIPSGVIAMSQDIDGLVETSTNLGVVTTSGSEVEIVCLSRSSVAPALQDTLSKIRSIGKLASVDVRESGGYPGWKPNLDSAILSKTKDVYRRLFGEYPAIKAIHAGLECGLIGEKVPGMDMVSMGPEIRGAHSPAERVNIPSVEKMWRLLVGLLKELGNY